MKTPIEDKERRRVRRRNKFAKDLQDYKFRQRIKPSKKQEYKREKVKVQDYDSTTD